MAPVTINIALSGLSIPPSLWPKCQSDQPLFSEERKRSRFRGSCFWGKPEEGLSWVGVCARGFLFSFLFFFRSGSSAGGLWEGRHGGASSIPFSSCHLRGRLGCSQAGGCVQSGRRGQAKVSLSPVRWSGAASSSSTAFYFIQRSSSRLPVRLFRCSLCLDKRIQTCAFILNKK